MSRIFTPRSECADDAVSNGPAPDETRSEATRPEAGGGVGTRVSAWIEPASSETRRQSLLETREIGEEPIYIGRRGPLAAPGAVAADHIIAEDEPYTVSRLHCSLRLGDGGVTVTDLDSRHGTIVDGQALGRRRGKHELELGPGEYELIVGRDDSPFRFRVVVR